MNRPATALACLACVLAFAGTSAHAQYKIVGPDGSITFTDRVPDANQGRVSNVSKRGGEIATAELPYDLRQVVQKFPVTLYTSSDCDPCRQGRDLLNRRGVPFQERTATTAEDRAQWQKVTGTQESPILMVGKQQLKAFNAASWNETLDAAGYPATSKLPVTYRQPDAIPLAPRQAATPQAAPEGRAEPGVAATPSGIGGVRF
jgi:glutaredoxin